MLLEEPELLDRDAARVRVRAQTLMADPDTDGFLRNPGPGGEPERGHEAGDRGARSKLDHSLFSPESSPAAPRAPGARYPTRRLGAGGANTRRRGLGSQCPGPWNFCRGLRRPVAGSGRENATRP